MEENHNWEVTSSNPIGRQRMDFFSLICCKKKESEAGYGPFEKILFCRKRN